MQVKPRGGRAAIEICEAIGATKAFSGEVGTGSPQKMRQNKKLERFAIELNRKPSGAPDKRTLLDVEKTPIVGIAPQVKIAKT